MLSISSNHVVRAILFDVDGTLVDSVPQCVAGLGDTFEAFGDRRPSDDEIRMMIGMPLTAQLKRFGCDKHPLDMLVDYTIERYAVHENLAQEFPGSTKALQIAFETGIKTAFVTSRNSIELQHLEEKYSGWKYSNAQICASHVPEPKPAPDSALLAMKQLGVEPDVTVMIGDSVYDLRCAKSAGIRCGAVLYGSGAREALIAETPNYIFETESDLQEWVIEQTEHSHATEEDRNRFEIRHSG